MKKRMDQDDVRAKATDTRRENEIEMQPVNDAIPSAAGCVQKQPEQELHQMRSRNGGHLVPDNPAGFPSAGNSLRAESQILDALRIKMNFAMVDAGEAFEQFG